MFLGLYKTPLKIQSFLIICRITGSGFSFYNPCFPLLDIFFIEQGKHIGNIMKIFRTYIFLVLCFGGEFLNDDNLLFD